MKSQPPHVHQIPESKLDKDPEPSIHIFNSLVLDDATRWFAEKINDDYFTSPADREVYMKAIDGEPMDFSTIRENIVDQTYSTSFQLYQDMEQTLKNALRFNHHSTSWAKEAARLYTILQAMKDQNVIEKASWKPCMDECRTCPQCNNIMHPTNCNEKTVARACSNCNEKIMNGPQMNCYFCYNHSDETHIICEKCARNNWHVDVKKTKKRGKKRKLLVDNDDVTNRNHKKRKLNASGFTDSPLYQYWLKHEQEITGLKQTIAINKMDYEERIQRHCKAKNDAIKEMDLLLENNKEMKQKIAELEANKKEMNAVRVKLENRTKAMEREIASNQIAYVNELQEYKEKILTLEKSLSDNTKAHQKELSRAKEMIERERKDKSDAMKEMDLLMENNKELKADNNEMNALCRKWKTLLKEWQDSVDNDKEMEITMGVDAIFDQPPASVLFESSYTINDHVVSDIHKELMQWIEEMGEEEHRHHQTKRKFKKSRREMNDMAQKHASFAKDLCTKIKKLRNELCEEKEMVMELQCQLDKCENQLKIRELEDEYGESETENDSANSNNTNE
eukprot:150032_1